DVDLLQDRSRGADRQAGAAIILRDQRRQIAADGEIIHHLGRITGALFQLAPVLAGIFRADLAYLVAQLRIILTELERVWGAIFERCLDIHGCSPGFRSLPRGRESRAKDGSPLSAGTSGENLYAALRVSA